MIWAPARSWKQGQLVATIYQRAAGWMTSCPLELGHITGTADAVVAAAL
jgi:hypothetical protein